VFYTTTVFESEAATTTRLVCSKSAGGGDHRFHCKGGRCVVAGGRGDWEKEERGGVVNLGNVDGQ
jgi:hypothetical protein